MFVASVWSMENISEVARTNIRMFCFLLIQTLGTCWAERISILICVFICMCFCSGGGIQSPTFPRFQISRLPDFQMPPQADSPLDPDLTPLPTHPGIKCVARSLCCDNTYPNKSTKVSHDFRRNTGNIWRCTHGLLASGFHTAVSKR